MAGMERFTLRARRVLSIAHQEAERRRNNVIGAEHLLLGLMNEEGGVAGRVLRELGLKVERVREVAERVTNVSTDFDPDRVELGSETQKALEFAVEETRRLGHHYIGTEHILLGLVRVEGTAMEVLMQLGITADQIQQQTQGVLNETTAVTQNTHSPDKAFEKLKQVFILHGQDEWKKTVASLIQNLGLVPVILHRKDEYGTIIEYLDKYSKDIALAVIILTNNDPNILQSDVKQPGWRVDHNYIYELGYFRGKLGRNRICVLYFDDIKDEVELLTVFMGVIFIPVDSAGAWMTRLAKAIQDTGTETNLKNKI